MELTRRSFLWTSAAGLGMACGGCSNEKPEQPTGAPPGGGPPLPASAAPVSAHLRFQGLFALAANDDFSEAQILMLNAGKNAQNIRRHTPIIRIALDRVAEPRTHDFLDKADPKLGVWLVNDCEITVAAGALENPPTAKKTGAGACPTSDEEWRDIRWIGDAKKIFGAGKSKVDPKFIDRNKPQALFDSHVATRFLLFNGTLESEKPQNPNYPDYQHAIFSFPEAAGSEPQPLTDTLRFTTNPASNLTLLLRGPKGEQREIKLTAGAQPVEVMCLNNLWADVVSPEMHITALFGLLKDQPSAVHPKPKRCVPPGDDLGPKDAGTKRDFPYYCPPMRIYI